METEYESVIEIGELIWVGVVYLVHASVLALHAGLASFLLGTGAHQLLAPRHDGPWLRRLGFTPGDGPQTRGLAIARIALGTLLLAPFVAGAPMGASLFASVGAIALLVLIERRVPLADRPRGRWVRHTAIAAAAVTSLFMLWEGEDNLVLGSDLLVKSMQWRNDELSWQLSQDPQSPKLGDLAPDFELQDPDGNARVRLSDFRGSRPVALIFGSYT